MFVFRTVLGRDTPECKKALAAVLNLILNRKEDPITDLEYKNPFHLNRYIVGKQTVMDIKVSTSHGEIIDVEMQVGKTKDYASRADRQEEIEALVKLGEEAIVLTDEILRKVSGKALTKASRS